MTERANPGRVRADVRRCRHGFEAGECDNNLCGHWRRHASNETCPDCADRLTSNTTHQARAGSPSPECAGSETDRRHP